MALDLSQLLAGCGLLVIMPHPDDETFACGGTIARAKERGARVWVMIMSAGDLRQYHAGGASISGERRAAELGEAMRCLGVEGHTVVYPDTERHLRLDAMPRRELIAQIEEESEVAINRVRPDIVILPAPSYNQDHEATFQAGFAACRPHLPSEKHFVPVVVSADSPQLGWSAAPAQFSVFVDISGAYLQQKLKAHACHRSQLRPPPHCGSLENVEWLARVRGGQVAVEAAEAFVCHRLLV
jgi:LmbE family N-acetylglucosaminyl deacetylase